MASFMSYFGGRRDPKQSARDAIVTLRQQLQMLEKKEEYLQKKIDEEVAKARANATTNKTGSWHIYLIIIMLIGIMWPSAATNALRRKKVHEQEMDRLQGTRMQLEMQVNTLESANMNAETMAALKKGADALKHIHGNMSVVLLPESEIELTPFSGLSTRSMRQCHLFRSKLKLRTRFRKRYLTRCMAQAIRLTRCACDRASSYQSSTHDVVLPFSG